MEVTITKENSWQRLGKTVSNQADEKSRKTNEELGNGTSMCLKSVAGAPWGKEGSFLECREARRK